MKFFIFDDEKTFEKSNLKANNKKNKILIFSQISKKNKKKLIGGIDLLNKYKKETQINFYRNLKKYKITNNNLCYLQLSDYSFADNNIRLFQKLYLIKKLIKNKNQKIILASNLINKNYLRDFGYKNINYLNKRIYLNFFLKKLKKKISNFKTLFYNFFTEIIFVLFKKSRGKKLGKNIIYTHLKKHWSLNKKNELEYVYFKKIKKYSFLISLMRRNERRLDFFKTNQLSEKIFSKSNFDIIENYSSIGSIVKAYFYSIKINFLIKLKDRHNFYFKDVINDSLIIDLAKQNSFQYSLKEFFKTNKVKNLCVPIFELAEGRTVISEANKSKNVFKTIGYQHGFMSDYSFQRFESSKNIFKTNGDKTVIPNKIFTSGEIYKKLIDKKIYNNQIIGSCRLTNLPKKYKLNFKKKINHAVMTDLHDWKLKIDQCIKLKNKNVFIKPHPYTTDKVKNYLKSKNTNLVILDSNNFDRKKISSILCSDSGVAIEYSLSGWPVFLINNSNFPNLSPLLMDNKNVCSINLFRDDIDYIEKLLKNKKQLREYIRKNLNKARMHCEYYGEKAEKRFNYFLNLS